MYCAQFTKVINSGLRPALVLLAILTFTQSLFAQESKVATASRALIAW